MNVKLPSGKVAPLEPPTLDALLSGGGNALALAAVVWAYPEVDVTTLGPADVLFVAGWALGQFCASPECVEFATVLLDFGQIPSQRLGVSDRSLAYALDRSCHLAVQAARTPAPEPVQFNGGLDE